MSDLLWVALGLLGSFGLAAIGDMVSEEARDRLDHLPNAILRLASQRLDPDKRALLYEEIWLPDLAYHLRGDEARPITRLYHGTRFALSMLASARRSARNLDSAAVQGDDQTLVLNEWRSRRRHPPVSSKVSILMCALNEERTIGRAVREILAVEYPCEIELIVVDDGSIDATASIVAQFTDPRLILHRHPRTLGRGAALRTAASLASGTHLLPFDADLEYTPKDIPRLIEPIMTGRFDVVYGTRLFGYNTVYQSFGYAVGNKVLTTMTNILFGSFLSDLHTCLKLMPVGMFNDLALSQNGLGMDTEITATLLRLGIKPFEVPVSYYSRSHAQGKKISYTDALGCLHILLQVRTTRKSRLLGSGIRGS